MWKSKLLQGCEGTYHSVVSVYVLCNILYCVVKRYATGLNVGTSHHAWHFMRTCHCKPKLYSFFATLCHTKPCHCMSCHDTSCHQSGVTCAAAPTPQDMISISCTWLTILFLVRGINDGDVMSQGPCSHHATSTTSLCFNLCKLAQKLSWFQVAMEEFRQGSLDKRLKDIDAMNLEKKKDLTAAGFRKNREGNKGTVAGHD